MINPLELRDQVQYYLESDINANQDRAMCIVEGLILPLLYGPAKVDEFTDKLRRLINHFSKENGSDTPDFVLAEFLSKQLETFDYFVRYRNNTKT